MLRKFLTGLRQNHFLRAISTTFLLNIGFAGLTFALTIVLARTLGSTELGAYNYAETWVEVLLLIALLGFNQLLVRKMPAYQVQQRWDLWNGIQKFAIRSSFLFSILLALLFVAIIWMLFGTNSFTFSTDNFPQIILEPKNSLIIQVCIIAAFLLPIRAIIVIQQSILHGMGYIASGLIPDYFLRVGGHFLVLLFLILLTSYSLSANIVMGAHFFVALFTAFVGWVMIRKWRLPEAQSVPAIYEAPKWLFTNLGFITNSLATLLTSRMNILILGAFTTLDQIGYYGVVLRIVAVIVLAQTATNAVLRPRIAQLFAEKKADELQDLITLGVRSVVIVSFPIGVAFILFGRFILELFGSEFVVAYPMLIVMCIGQMMNTFSGPVGNLLTMTKYEWEQSFASLFVLVISFIFALILIPLYGGLGAAIATAIGFAIRNFVLVGVVYWRLKIWSLPFSIKRTF
ncbi:MAG: oligosaccharide flippase family protein [Anaerolineae bacterium]